MKFIMDEKLNSIIKVIGVGGGGCNAVNHMYQKGIVGVDFLICNTDAQSLEDSPVTHKIQLGDNGLGAGAKPDMGATATRENLSDILDYISDNTKMVFITAGMGGGTGTGGAPIVAEECKRRGILTVGICTTPFDWEGPSRTEFAQAGIEALKKHVDTLIIISNDKLEEMYADIDIDDAFVKADDVLATAAKGIAEIITVGGKVNVDFEDVKTVMENSGVAIMGTGFGTGEGRAMEAVIEALDSPLLNDNNIKGAKKVLLNITYGSTGFKMNEFKEISRYVQQEAGGNADIIWGKCKDESMADTIKIVLIATGFEGDQKKYYNGNTEKTVSLDSTYTIETLLAQDEPDVPPLRPLSQFSDNDNSPKKTAPADNIVRISLDQPLDYNEAIRNQREVTDNNGGFSSANTYNGKQNVYNNEPPKEDTPYSNDLEDRGLKFKELSFKTHQDKSDLVRQKIEAMKQRAAFQAKGVNLVSGGVSNQHDASNYSVRRNDNGDTGFSKNKFLHNPKPD